MFGRDNKLKNQDKEGMSAVAARNGSAILYHAPSTFGIHASSHAYMLPNTHESLPSLGLYAKLSEAVPSRAANSQALHFD